MFARKAGGFTPARVLNASATELQAVVPDEAVTGRVRVLTATGEAESPEDFRLQPPAGPFVMDFRPKFGPPGTVVTLTGFNLADAGRSETGRQGDKQTRRQKASENSSLVTRHSSLSSVTFAGSSGTRALAQVISASPTEIKAIVPETAQTGAIEIRNGLGLGRTREPFAVETGGFRLTAAPTIAQTVEGGRAAVMVYVTGEVKTFTSLAKLSVVGLPPNVEAKFDREHITSGAFATLTLDLRDSGLTPGGYDFTIQAVAPWAAGEVMREAKARLSVVPGNQTTLSGRVLSTDDDPIPNVTASLDGRSAVTDAAGMFILTNIRPGVERAVMIDGRTANFPNRSYPVIVEPAEVIEGKANRVPYTFYLPRIDVEHEVEIDPNRDTAVTTPRVPGLKLVVPAGSRLRQRDGNPVTRASLTPVPIDRTPAPLPSGIAFTMVFTAQAGGTDSDFPMPVTFPNLTNEAPGTPCDLWNFNHDEARWEIYGTGKVSPDGRTVEPDVDPATGKPFGLPYFSWGGMSPRPDVSNDNGDGPGPGGPGGGDPADCPSSRGSKPVNFATGFKVETETDVAWSGARGGLSLTRTHLNTQFAGRFGLGWTDNFSTTVGGSNDGMSATVFISGRNQAWQFGFERTEAIEGTDEPVRVYTNRLQAPLLGDELRQLPERIVNGQTLLPTWEYRTKSGIRLIFDRFGRWTDTIDRNHNRTKLEYDTQSRLVKITDPVGRSLAFAYRQPGPRTAGLQNLVETVTDSLGRVWRYVYGEDNGRPLTPDFNAFLLTEVIDPLGQRMQYGYIPIRAVAPGQPRNGGRLERVIDKRGNVVKEIEYDAGGSGRVTRQRFADGGVEKYDYLIAGGRVVQVVITDPIGRVTSRRFNSAGYVIEESNALQQTRKINRDFNNLLLSQTVPNGEATTRQRDERGNVIVSTDRSNFAENYIYENNSNQLTEKTDQLGNKTNFIYDNNGNNTTGINAAGEIIKYFYDQYGQLIEIIDTLGNSTKIGYDDFGNVLSQFDPLNHIVKYENNIFGWKTAIINQLGQRIEIKYDILGRIVEQKRSNGSIVKTIYDENGNQVNTIDEVGNSLKKEYDEKNRTVRIIDQLGRFSECKYNFANEKIETRSYSSSITEYKYSQTGKLIEVVDPLKRSIQYVYDMEDKIIKMVDEKFNCISYFYDSTGRVIEERNSLGQSTKFEYSATGLLSTIIDPMGRLTSLTQDALGRTIKTVYPDATVTFQYDGLGRIAEITDTQGGVISWTYDEANRVLTETTSTGLIQYTYTDTNQIKSLKIGDQPEIVYGYDSADQATSIQQGNNIFQFEYDSFSRIVKIRRPNRIDTKYVYDEVSRLKQLQHINSSTNKIMENFNYSYTLDDEVELISSQSQYTAMESEKFISPANKANRINIIGLENNFYNEIGQIIRKVVNGNSIDYKWDVRGRLTEVKFSNGKTVYYNYDTLGRMIYRAEGDKISRFIHNGNSVVQEIKNDGQKINYINGLSADQKLMQSDGNNLLYFLHNHLNSTMLLADSNGNILEQNQYKPFGDSSGSEKTRFGFAGRERDELTGLIFYRTRWYDPGQGRFISEDHAEMTFPTNRYVYVENNPINHVDPHGEWGTGTMCVAGIITVGDYIHQASVKRVLESLGVESWKILILQDAQTFADLPMFQRTDASHRHGMSSVYELKREARARGNFLMREEISIARAAKKAGDDRKGLRHLGIAMHALQDWTSPVHNGWQIWNEEWQKWYKVWGVVHGAQENFDPGFGSSLDEATRRIWEYYICEDKDFPGDFFTLPPDRKP